MAELTLSLGGLATALVTSERDVADLVATRYAGFLARGPADWCVEVARRPEGLVGVPDVTVRDDGPARVVVERHDFLAHLDLRARRGRLALGAIDAIALDTFLRVTYSLALLPAGGLLVHAASLARDGRAWVFSGPSGSGKTTLARLSGDARLLSDEISIIRCAPDGGVACHGSPFWGDLGRPGDNSAVPVAAIHFLRHADEHAATALAPRAALAALLPNVLFFAADAGLVARVLDIAARVTAAVPCFALGFRPEPAVWEVIAVA